MYKKITHNIVEEHFDHPATLPNGMLTAMNGTGGSWKSERWGGFFHYLVWLYVVVWCASVFV